MAKTYPFFVDPSETPVAELGSGFIQSYLGSGAISKGFAVATQKRVYFNGKSYFRDSKGNWRKQLQGKTVDLKDVTGTGYTSMRQLWLLITGIASFFWPLVELFVEWNLRRATNSYYLKVSFLDYISNVLLPMFIMGIIPLLIFWAFFFLRRRTLFNIEFAGGSISFNTSWYSKDEIDNFQKNLRQAMAAVKDIAPAPAAVVVQAPVTPAQAPSATGTAKEKVEVLREYAKLKDEGIISEEEFQKMKAELMSENK